MPLTLLAGPANAGKVARLLQGYLDSLDREPVLIVPNRSDVDPVERELLRAQPALLGGSIGTFDDVFERLAHRVEERPVASPAQRAIVARRAIAQAPLNGLGPSARFAGFADALLQAVAELEAGLLDPADLPGDLGVLYGAYRAELDRLGLADRGLVRAAALRRLESDFEAWHGEPVFAYGFEDLTGAEWRLLETLAGRTEVTVSLPYEPARPAFESLQRTAEDLAGLAQGRVEELPPRFDEVAHPALAHVERGLFSDTAAGQVASDGAVRFLEGAGTRGTLELVGEEVLALLRSGAEPDGIGIVCPSLERWRAPLETAFGALGIPHAVDGETRLAATPFGRALLGVLRFSWLGSGRRDLFAYLRSPYSGWPRAAADFVEGRLRGRAVADPTRVLEEAERLRGNPVPGVGELRGADDPVAAVRELATSMLRAAFGVDSPQATDEIRRDLRTFESVGKLLAELERLRALGGAVEREDVAAALERYTLRVAPDGAGRVAVLDLMRARTRRFDHVFVLGLEEGSLPRRGGGTPFLDDDARRELDGRGARLLRADPVSRDRYLFYTACTRATKRLTLVREAASDEGSPREPSPFWDEVAALIEPDERAHWTRSRRLSALTWPLEGAPTERERLRALATLGEAGAALARANGWERRLDRARRAFTRQTRLRNPVVIEQLGSRTTFNVTELERFADCSSAWFVERLLSPRTIDAEVDPKLRGSVAHTALHRFFAGLPKEVGTERVEPQRVEEAVRFMRKCLDGALEGVGMEMTPMQRRELDQGLWRDLEWLVRDEAASELPLVPRRFEVGFGTERAAPELQRGLEIGEGLTLSGKIDRIDLDPFAARGIVQDYKSGKSAHSATRIEEELRLQIPLYMLVLRDLVGIEPLGGVYRPLAGARKPRGLLREADRESLPDFTKTDYLDEEAFWGQVDKARETAGRLAGRIRSGDVDHDPLGGACPSWCDLWPMCRVRRS
jgi:ATP-dependent helicase/nuclease subunit B